MSENGPYVIYGPDKVAQLLGLQAGFFRYLTKPINVIEFMETLNTALEFAERGMGQGSRTPR